MLDAVLGEDLAVLLRGQSVRDQCVIIAESMPTGERIEKCGSW